MLVYEGIDSFNRPVFKDENSRARYGSTGKLFDYCASEDEVLLQVTEADLVYFGNSFNCEPMGTSMPASLRIQRSELQKLQRDKNELLRAYREVIEYLEYVEGASPQYLRKKRELIREMEGDS